MGSSKDLRVRSCEINVTVLLFTQTEVFRALCFHRFVENTQPALAPVARSLVIDVLPSSDEMCQMDAISARELGLVHSLRVGGIEANKYTLFGEFLRRHQKGSIVQIQFEDQGQRFLVDVINHTCTTPDQRALKWRLLQPFKRREHIEEQLNNVRELMSDESPGCS